MLKERVQQRLEALNISHWEASRRAGRHRNFVYDLLEDRKQTPRQKTIRALARALECSVEYLTGASADIGEPPLDTSEPEEAGGLPVVGTIEEGAWRRPTTQPRGSVMIMPDPRYPGRQFAYVFRGEPEGGLEDGMFVIAVDPADYERQLGSPTAGNPVVVELRRKALNEVQTVLRPWSPHLESAQSNREIDARVVGIVAATFRLY